MRLYAYVYSERDGSATVLTGYRRGSAAERSLVYTLPEEAYEHRALARAKARAANRPVKLIAFDSSETLETFPP